MLLHQCEVFLNRHFYNVYNLVKELLLELCIIINYFVLAFVGELAYLAPQLWGWLHHTVNAHVLGKSLRTGQRSFVFDLSAICDIIAACF